MKKSISITIKSKKRLASFSYSNDEDFLGEQSFRYMRDILLNSLSSESLNLAFKQGYISISQKYGKNKRRLE